MHDEMESLERNGTHLLFVKHMFATLALAQLKLFSRIHLTSRWTKGKTSDV
jgi:hypothetical protein